MSLPRLLFLYPPLLTRRLLTPPTKFPPCRTPIPSIRYQIQLRNHRHGTAVEPPPPPPEPPKGSQKEPPPPSKKEEPGPGKPPESVQAAGDDESAAAASAKSSPSSATTTATTTITENSSEANKEVLMPSNIAPGPHIHHFDTYSLVKSLEGEGFTEGQSIAVMKGVRELLARNLEIARGNLVSKSNVENESYLFHAACSELRNEIQTNRKTALETLRAERTSIQHEFDSLNQRFLEEVMGLKDELNGLFNDRKMVTRAEQRAMENKIQELNYKITILINSDLKSEIEKLRWITTRRGLIAIAILAMFVVTSIRFSKQGEEKDKKLREKHHERREGGGDRDGNHELVAAGQGNIVERLAGSENTLVSLG